MPTIREYSPTNDRGIDSGRSTSASGRSIGSHQRRWNAISSPPPIASSIMGFEDEVEQSHRRPCRLADGRSKRTCELTSSTVPRGTPFHCWVDFEFSPIGFDPERFSCCRGGCLPGPPELGAINPYAVHDDGQPASQCHDRLLHSASPGDLHGPSLE